MTGNTGHGLGYCAEASTSGDGEQAYREAGIPERNGPVSAVRYHDEGRAGGRDSHDLAGEHGNLCSKREPGIATICATTDGSPPIAALLTMQTKRGRAEGYGI